MRDDVESATSLFSGGRYHNAKFSSTLQLQFSSVLMKISFRGKAL